MSLPVRAICAYLRRDRYTDACIERRAEEGGL